MKKLAVIFLLLCILLTGCGEKQWYPDTTEVYFDTKSITVEKLYENTDLGSDEMDYYKVTTKADSSSKEGYSLEATALIGIKYHPEKYYDVYNMEYYDYTIEEIRDIEVTGVSDIGLWWESYSEQPFFDIAMSKDCVFVWSVGHFKGEHDKKVKNISDFLPGIFLKHDTSVKEYFCSDAVNFSIKLYIDEIISCSSEPYHITAKSIKSTAAVEAE